MSNRIAFDVYAFMEQAKQLDDDALNTRPHLPSLEERLARKIMLEEELEEYTRAEQDHNLLAIADGLIDIVYVAVGTCVKYGIPFEVVWDAVHNANMKKLLPSPVLSEMGKVMKPVNWTPPNILKALMEFGYDPLADVFPPPVKE